MSEDPGELRFESYDEAFGIREAWRCIRGMLQGSRTLVDGEPGNLQRVADGLTSVAVKLLCDLIAGESGPPSERVIQEAIEFAEARITDTELAMLDDGRLPPQAPPPPDPGDAP